MQQRSVVRFLLSLFLLGCAAPIHESYADPIVVRSGSLRVGLAEAATATALSAPGFSVEFIQFRPTLPCPSCSLFDASVTGVIDFGQDSFVLDGTRYSITSGSLRVVSGTFPVPPIQPDVVIRLPYQFNGSLVGTAGSSTRRVDLVGSGTAAVLFSPFAPPEGIPTDTMNWLGTDYTFLAPAPIPEPAMLVPISIAIGARLIRARRVRRVD